MPTSYHVPGPVLCKVGTGAGSPPALETLGLSEDGFSISVRLMHEDVITDAAARAPAEKQFMGSTAVVRGRVPVYDEAVFAKLRQKMLASATDGAFGPPGTLLATGGFANKLVLASADLPWRFYTTILADAQDAKLGTKYTVWDLVWHAWAFVAGADATSSGKILFDHTDAA